MKKSIATIAVLATAAVTAAPALASTPVRIDDCAAHAQVKPSGLTLYCGDAGDFLAKLRWSDWGAATARASGVEVTNTCKPNCAAGNAVSKPVRVTASGLRGGRYTTLTVGRTHWELTPRGPVPA